MHLPLLESTFIRFMNPGSVTPMNPKLVLIFLWITALTLPSFSFSTMHAGPNHDAKGNRSYEEERELTIPAPAELVVNAGKNGGISVQGWDRPEVKIIAKVSVYCGSAAEAEENFSNIKVIAENKIYPTGPGTNWVVSFEIFAPRKLPADLEAFNGGVSIKSMASKISMRTVNGGISVIHSGGQIQGKTTNGGLNIQCDGTSWNGQGLDLVTTNGGVSISIPEEFNCELETGTVNGGIRFDFPITVQGEIDRSFDSVMGKGGARIRAVTTNGAVTISN